MTDYPCGKFGDYIFNRFGDIERTDGIADTHTETRMNDLLSSAGTRDVNSGR